MIKQSKKKFNYSRNTGPPLSPNVKLPLEVLLAQNWDGKSSFGNFLLRVNGEIEDMLASVEYFSLHSSFDLKNSSQYLHWN